jgi:hypothetical protein
VLPGTYFSFIFGITASIVVGVGDVWFRSGNIGWAETAHPTLREDDKSLFPIVRFLGTAWIAMGFAILSILFGR